MKKFICGFLMAILLLVAMPVFGVAKQQIDIAINSIKVIINGQELTEDNIIYNGTVYIQLETVANLLGAKVQIEKEEIIPKKPGIVGVPYIENHVEVTRPEE